MHAIQAIDARNVPNLVRGAKDNVQLTCMRNIFIPEGAPNGKLVERRCGIHGLVLDFAAVGDERNGWHPCKFHKRNDTSTAIGMNMVCLNVGSPMRTTVVQSCAPIGLWRRKQQKMSMRHKINLHHPGPWHPEFQSPTAPPLDTSFKTAQRGNCNGTTL